MGRHSRSNQAATAKRVACRAITDKAPPNRCRVAAAIRPGDGCESSGGGGQSRGVKRLWPGLLLPGGSGWLPTSPFATLICGTEPALAYFTLTMCPPRLSAGVLVGSGGGARRAPCRWTAGRASCKLLLAYGEHSARPSIPKCGTRNEILLRFASVLLPRKHPVEALCKVIAES